jgi:hypothetical protein
MGKKWKKMLLEEGRLEKKQINKLREAEDLIKFTKKLSLMLFDFEELARQNGNGLPTNENFRKKLEFLRRAVDCRKNEMETTEAFIAKFLMQQLRDYRRHHGPNKEFLLAQIKEAQQRKKLKKMDNSIDNVPSTPSVILTEYDVE